MNVEQLREYCLSLGEVEEKIPIELDRDISDSMIFNLVSRAYEIIKVKYTHS